MTSTLTPTLSPMRGEIVRRVLRPAFRCVRFRRLTLHAARTAKRAVTTFKLTLTGSSHISRSAAAEEQPCAATQACKNECGRFGNQIDREGRHGGAGSNRRRRTIGRGCQDEGSRMTPVHGTGVISPVVCRYYQRDQIASGRRSSRHMEDTSGDSLTRNGKGTGVKSGGAAKPRSQSQTSTESGWIHKIARVRAHRPGNIPERPI